MASTRQIEANLRNSKLSTGPSDTAKSRLNASKHGLTGNPQGPEPGREAEFADRRARWAVEFRPVGDPANFALDRAVAASFRIERCERHVEELRVQGQKRARVTWDRDKKAEAAAVFARLGKEPVLASSLLQTTLAGVCLMIDAWTGLLEAMREEGKEWGEAEQSRAMDLLGVDPLCRSGRRPIDPPDGGDRREYRAALIKGQLDELDSYREELEELDESDRDFAMDGEADLQSKATQLALRYEREAWRRYTKAILELREASPAPVAPMARPSSPPPAPKAAPPAPIEPKLDPDEMSDEEFAASLGYGSVQEWDEALEAEDRRVAELRALLQLGRETKRSQIEASRGGLAVGSAASGA